MIRCHQRVTLAVHAIPRGETLVGSLTLLLARLTPLRVKVKRLYLDRGFYSVPVIRWLKALNIPFLMHVIIRGKTGGTRPGTTELSRDPYWCRKLLSVSCKTVVFPDYLGEGFEHALLESPVRWQV